MGYRFIREDHWNQGQNLALTTPRAAQRAGRRRLSGTIVMSGRHGAFFGTDAVFGSPSLGTGALPPNW